MPNNQAYSRAICASAVILLAGAIGGCSSGPGGGTGAAGGSGRTGLEAALSHVADAPGARAQIAYDDTADLVRLSGTKLGTTKGFALLRGWGANSIVAMPELAGDTGISLFAEDYAISAGNPPRMLTLLHGGQSASLVTGRLTKLGWKRNGGTLVGPPGVSGTPKASLFAFQMHEVRANGSDVTFGESGADLSGIRSASSSTLASDPLVSALAACLGDVVAAQMGVGGDLGGRHPAGVAIGVRTPASDAATPRAVACVAWSSQAGAARYTADVRKALSRGLSFATGQPYSALLTHTSVTGIGGSQHIVQWQADTRHRADLIFQMYINRDLPALPDCAKIPAPARNRFNGCG